MRPKFFWAACSAAMLVSPVCGAQTPSQPPAETVPQAKPLQPGESLSERLSRTDGVIRPPAGAAPDMRVPAPVPEPNTTPVIPPPGSPGGDQRVQPK